MKKKTIPQALKASMVVLNCLLFSCAQPTAKAQDILSPKPPVSKGYKLIEGDILVPVEFDSGGFQQEAVAKSTDLWPNGEVAYVFDDNVSSDNRQWMRDAMAIWESVAKVNFKPRDFPSDTHWIHIQNSTGNSSGIGRPFISHDVNIRDWESLYVIVHELGHTLGFWHEQSRSDRNSYVQINWENILEDKERNFEMHDEADHYGPYDFDSVMHYGACLFSNCGSCDCADADCRTITVLPPYNADWQCEIGQLDHLSYWDKRVMSFLYPEDDWRFVDMTRWHSALPMGTFLDPFFYFTSTIPLLDGVTSVPPGGTIWIGPGVYAAVGTYSKPMTIRSAIGGAALQ